jgi:glucose-1-phosphate thymidylyltransferase
MKALILARGRGTRMQAESTTASLTPEQSAAAGRGWKALMPIGRHRFLDFILSSLADAGCADIGLLIGPDQHEDFASYRRRRPASRTRLTFIEQDEPRGSADAVLCAETWVGGEPFVVVNGDNLYPIDALSRLVQLDGPGLAVFERERLIQTSNIPTSRIAAFAWLELSADGTLMRIVEKPSPEFVARASGTVLLSMNVWRFDRRIFDACRDIGKSPRGEYELPTAVQFAIDRGVRFEAIPAAGAVLDLSSRDDVRAVSERLEGIEPRP